jgi:hypothetical protein
MVLIAWAIVGTLLAGVAAVVLGGATVWHTRGVQRWRRSAILAAAALPFLCFAWAGAVFMFQALVNEAVFHRDPGLGDAWETPLPNGYALLMIDESDHGSVYNPKTQVPGGVSEQVRPMLGPTAMTLAWIPTSCWTRKAVGERISPPTTRCFELPRKSEFSRTSNPSPRSTRIIASPGSTRSRLFFSSFLP